MTDLLGQIARARADALIRGERGLRLLLGRDAAEELTRDFRGALPFSRLDPPEILDMPVMILGMPFQIIDDLAGYTIISDGGACEAPGSQ